MKKEIIKILKEHTNVLTIDSLKCFYAKEIFPNPVNHEEFEKELKSLIEKGIVECSRMGEWYYNLK